MIPVWGESGEYIAKFHDPSYQELPRLEAATTEWARASGIRTHVTQLVMTSDFLELPTGLPLGDGKVLLAERFDRLPGGKVHCEDFGQLLDRPPGDQQYQGSYEAIAGAIGALCAEDAREYVERLAFMIVSGNGDAHLKNWGVVYPDRRSARLGPAYDLVATVARIRDENLALTIDGNTSFESVGLQSFTSMAQVFKLGHDEVTGWVVEAVHRAVEAWQSRSVRENFSTDEIKRLQVHSATTPLWAV